jgi:hypothetical protein
MRHLVVANLPAAREDDADDGAAAAAARPMSRWVSPSRSERTGRDGTRASKCARARAWLACPMEAG